MRRRQVRDSFSDVGPAIAWAGEQIPDTPAETRFAIEVCLEEALANLILHGKVRTESKDIALAIGTDVSGVTVEITDRCQPFDVAHATAPARERLSEGGRGLTLLHRFASDLDYAAGAAGNTLTLRFRPA